MAILRIAGGFLLPTLLAMAPSPRAEGPLAAVADDGRVYAAASDLSGAFGGWAQLDDFGIGNLRGVALDHFDRDGYLDLVTGRVSGTHIVLYKYPGLLGGGFGTRQRLGEFAATGSYLMDLASGDCNGDHIADLVANTNTTTVAFLMSGPSGFQVRTEALENGTGRGMDLGDVNADGHLDLVRARQGDGQVSLYLGNGAGAFAFLRSVGDAGSDPYGVAVADFNSDGHLDVLANEGSSGNATLWRGNGAGTFLPGMTPSGADFNNFAAFDAFDYNGDGNTDLVASTYSSQAVQYAPGLGNGNFGSAVRVNPASPSPGNLLGIAAPPCRHPRAPFARVTPAEQTLAAGASAVLDGSGSTAAAGSALAERTWSFGDGMTATGAAADHTYAAKGRYWPQHRVRSDNGLADLAKVLAIVTGPPPTAHAGGPYAFTEAQAVGEAWTGQLDGRATLNDGGEGAAYTWNLMPDIAFSDEFPAPLDPAAWTSAGSQAAGGTLRVASTSLGDWGASHVASVANFPRRRGLTFYTRMVSRSSENIMFGIKNTTANHHYNQLQHAFYVAGTSLLIYEAGSSRGSFRTIAYNVWYDLRIELQAAGAQYWFRASGTGEPWELVYTSTHNSGPEVKAGFSGYTQGRNEFDYVYLGRRAEGALVTETFGGPGTFPVSLTVTDFLGQSSTATATVTTSGDQPPTARTGGPYLFGEGSALNGQYVAVLDGRTASDDHGIARYDWDFGDGATGTGAQPTHTYAGRGPYTIRLTVRDHAGQTHSDQGVVSFGAGAPPVARIQGPASVDESAANAGAWSATFQAGTSSDDFGIWRYQWNFGNGRTATTATATTQYTAVGDYTATLTIFDHAGQSHSATHSIRVEANALPAARITGPSQVDESAARHGLFTAAFNAAPSSDDFGIWRYQWNFGDGGTATTANPTHQFAGPGAYTVRLTVFDHAGQSHFADHPIAFAANQPPVARIAAGAATVEGAREVAFSGLPSSDDFGISDWAWDFGERLFAFDGTVLSPVDWQASAGVIQDGRVILTGTGAFGARHVQSVRAYQRESELRARVRVPAGTHQGAIGFKALNETAAQADFEHAIYLNNGRWYTIENGGAASHATYPANAEYEIRIVTKAAGADYFIRPIASSAWTLLRSTTAHAAYPLEAAWSVVSGTFEFDDAAVRARAHGPEAYGAFGPGGEARLTVTDHARQTHTAVQAIAVIQGAPPAAAIQGPDSYGVGLEAGFSGLGSSDDHGIARYEWDFGDGTTASGDRVGHVYAAAGVHTVRLTVFDFAGQAGTAARPVNITGQNMVRCVPWRFNNGIEVPHETWTGKLITLKGVASTAPRPFTYTWDFGDGSPPATGSVTTEAQAYGVQAQHAYSGPHGTPYVATLSIVDAAGARSTDTYPLIMRDRSLAVEANVAIDEALWYLHKAQVRTVSGGMALSHWISYGNYRTNVSASAIQAFEINGHQPQGDQAQDPYVETVRRGLDHLMTLVSYNNIGPQTHGNPDANGNGIGLGGTEADQPYQMGAVMDAIIASGSPTFLSRTGGTNVRGRRYLDLVQDMADMYAWGQEEAAGGRGGWRYSWHGGSDNSAAQWGAIGLIPAERLWGIAVPAFVKTENQLWLNASYQAGSATCGFGYSSPGHSLEQTSSGMVQLAFQRAARNSTQWACTEARMDNLWASFLSANTTYGYYAFTKAMRLAPTPVINLSVSGRDWFDAEPDGLRRTLVGRQRADGSWLSNHGLPSEPVINTAWSTIILTPTLFENPPVAVIHASPNPGAVGQPVRFDGSQSYHVDPFRRVASFAWDFDAADGVDWDTPDAEGPVANHAFGALRSYTVSLRVGDDQDPPNFDVATARIDITIPPHPPTAVPGGPYVAAAGEAVALDGSGSFDIDAAQGDAVTAWGWETDFQNPRDFDDALGARPSGVIFPAAGTYNVGLRVTDNTSVAFPQSGRPNLTHETYTTVQVHDRCLESLAARGKAAMVALTWTHDGSPAYTVLRSTASPSYGFEEIGTTSSTYSTFIDYNVETGRTYYYRVRGADGCASYAVSIAPRFRSTNRRPVITSTPVTAAREAQAYAYDAEAADPEGQALTWFLDQAPAGMTVNAATGLLAWTPTQAQVGTHPVSLRAVDPGDMAVVQAFLITVAARPNLPPVPAITAPAQALSGQPLLFDGSGTTDPEGDTPLAFAWNFGDGTVASGPSATHAFGTAGTFVVTLFATDSRGATEAATHTVVVDDPNRAPVARPGGPYTVSAGDPLTLDGGASSDPDGDPIAFLWHFGDDSDPVAGAVATHVYAAEGTYQASLEVSDGRGGIGGATVPVVVTGANHAPAARIAAARTFANPGEEIGFDATSSTDADGDALVYSWAFGDGSATTGDQVTHVYGTPGRFTVALTADDQRGRQGTATAEIHVNAPPAFADPGNVSAAEDAPLVLPLSAPDADGHAVTFSLLQGPAGLTLQNGPGSLFWLPGNGDVGAHTVRLRAEDGFGGADETQFTLTVTDVNDPPEITSNPVLQAVELARYLYGATVADVDAGDAVTFSLPESPAGMSVDPVTGLVSWTPTHAQVGNHNVTLVAADAAGARDAQAFTVTVVELPWAPEFTSVPPAAATEDQPFRYQAAATDLNAADALVFSFVSAPGGMAVDPATGLVTWTPLNEHVGPRTARLRVSDGALSADQEFTLTVANVNDAPVFPATGPGVAVVGEDLGFRAQAADPDAGDRITYALAQGSGNAVINPTSGLLSWIPTEAELGEQPFRILAEDASGAFASLEFTVRVQRTPEPPAFSSVAPTAATQGLPYEYQASAADPNGDPMTFGLVSGPAGLAVSPGGRVTFTPGPAQTGNQDVRIYVTDSRFTVEQAFTLAVANVNDDPVIASAPGVTGTDGVTYSYQAEAADADGDALAYSLARAPAGMAVSAGGLVTWPDDGARPLQSEVELRVTDGQGGETSQSWTIRIVPDNVPPAVSIRVSANPASPGQFVTITVEAADNVGVQSRSLLIDGAEVALTGAQYQYLAGAAGEVALAASASDLNGNSGAASATLRISGTADATAPQVTLTFGPPNPEVGQLVTFLIGAADAGGIDPERVWLQVDGQYLPVAEGRAEFRPLTRGAFTAVATAYDLSGNYGEAGATLNASLPGGDAEPPVAQASGPADNTQVTTSVPITGTVSDANFAYYTLAYREEGTPEWVEFRRSTTPVTDGTLGVLDASGMVNGDYSLRVAVFDRYGNSSSDLVPVTVSGDRKLGQFRLNFTDMTLNLTGLDVQIGRTYDSRNKRKGDFGIGWTLDIASAAKVVERHDPARKWETYCTRTLLGGCIEWGTRPSADHHITVFLPGLTKQEFELETNTTYASPGGLVSGEFSCRALPGTFTKLEPIAGHYYEFLLGGEFLDFDFEPVNPTQYRLTLLDGTEYIVDQEAGRVSRIRDANGNTVFISAGAITHSDGWQIRIDRDAQGRVTSIEDADARTLRYAYDGHGNLKSVTDAVGNVTRFKYDPYHYLTDIIDPRGVRAARTEFDDDGKIIRQTNADGRAMEVERDVEAGIETITDFDGNVTRYTYDAEGNITSRRDTRGNLWTYSHDSRGRVLETRNPDGTLLRSAYDASGNEITATDALGNVTSFTYDAKGRQTSKTDRLGRVTRYVFDGRGNQIEEIGPDGATLWRRTFDGSGNLLTETDALGNLTRHAYAEGRLTMTTDPLGRVTRFTRDARGNILTQTDARGNVTRFTYNDNNQPLTVTDPLGGTEATAYTSFRRLLSKTDKLGNVLRVEYDPVGMERARRYPDGSTVARFYDGQGNATRITDETGRETRTAYDDGARPVEINRPDGGREVYVYDPMGRRVMVVDGLGRETRMAYDANGNHILTRSPSGHEFRFEYDAEGNRTAMVDPLGRRTVFEFDAYNRVILTRDPEGGVTRIAFDAKGRKVEETDAAGRVARYQHDAADNLIRVTDAAGGITGYAYDGNNNLLVQRDARGGETRFEYDALDRLAAKVLPDGARETFAYDAEGNLLVRTLPTGETVTHAYDTRGREIERRYSASGRTVRTRYHADGKRSSVEDHRGITRYAYEAAGRLAGIENPDGTYLRYQYDRAGNKSQTLFGRNLAQWGSASFTYDPENRLATVSQGTLTTTYGYDPAGSRVSTAHSNGVSSAYQYDGLGRLTRVAHTDGGGGVASLYRYALDPTGLRTRVEELGGSAVDYAYDDLMRLVRERRTGPSAQEAEYAYDPVGNRTAMTRDGQAHAYAYDSRDRLLQETGPAGATTYAYDAAGRVTLKAAPGATAEYGWEDGDRLVSYASGGQTSRYEYDAEGRKVADVGATRKAYLIDPTLPYGQVVAEYGEGDSPQAVYAYGLERISQTRDGVVRVYLADGQGSTRQLADGQGAVTDDYTYGAFGDLIARTGSSENAFLYAGEQLDAQSSSYYLRARWMDPGTGRFQSMDAFQGDQLSPVSLHKYLYANGSPISFSDPSGNMSLGSMAAISACVGIMASIATVGYGFFNYYNFPSGVRGTIIHEAIFPFYRAAGFLCNNWIAKSNNPPIDRYRPDCRHHGPGPFAGQVYEIKPAGLIADALDDLAFYIPRLAARYPTVPWHAGVGPLLCPPTMRLPQFPGIMINIFIPLPGVIAYNPTPDYAMAARNGATAFAITFACLWLRGNIGQLMPKPGPVPIPAPAF